MALNLGQITTLYLTHGQSLYGGEAISQQQHALQCAQLAEQAGASPMLVAAALLHDMGHLLPNTLDTASCVDDLHQFRSIPFLRSVFSDAVIEPVCLHVDAKRYLCHAEPGYWSGLSAASKRSLQVQGGPFSGAEAAAFMARPFAADAVALRRWDDLAKDPYAMPPPWTHYEKVLEEASASRPGSWVG